MMALLMPLLKIFLLLFKLSLILMLAIVEVVVDLDLESLMLLSIFFVGFVKSNNRDDPTRNCCPDSILDWYWDRVGFGPNDLILNTA